MKIKPIFTYYLIALLFTGSCDFTSSGKQTDNKHTAKDSVAIAISYATPKDSLEYVANDTKSSAYNRIIACDILAYNLVYSDISQSMSYAQMGLDLSEKIKNDSLTASLYRDLGMAYQVKNNYDTAQCYYEKSLFYALENKDEHLESFLYLAYGLLYSDMSQYEKSVEYYEKAIRLCEKLGLQKRYNTIVSNIGITYLKLQNYELAEQYFLKAKDIFLKNPYPDGLANVYLNMGIMYYEQKKMEEAHEATMECLKIFRSVSNKTGEALALTNQSRLLAENKKYNEALEVAHKSLKLAEEVGYPYVIKKALDELSTLHYDMGNYRLSEEYANREVAFVDSTAATELMLLYKKLLPIYIKQGKQEKAIRALEKHDSLLQVVNSVKVLDNYAEMHTKFETEKKELKIAALETEKYLLEREKRLTLLLGIAGSTVLLLALAFFIVRQRLSRQKVARLEQEKQLIATQAVLDGETRERARLARDLHDGLGSMLTGARLNLLEMKKGVILQYAEVERFDKALGLLDQSVREMRRVAHHLMPDSLSRFGLKPAIDEFCRSLSANISFDYFGDEVRLDPKLEVLIYRCIHELVNNALKYSGATSIMVQIMQEANRIALTVQDNGCGFDPEAPTEGTGLKNIRTRIASYDGNIQIDAKEDEGTEVNIEIQLRTTNYELRK